MDQQTSTVPYLPRNFYSYFRDCYRLDYREFLVDNILAQKYSYKWFASNEEELLTQNLPIIPYNNPKVQELEKDLELYSLEKRLYYAAFFVLGKSKNPLIKDKRYCAPLLLYPAKVITLDEEKFLQLENEPVAINRSVLSNLDFRPSAPSKDQFMNELNELLTSEPKNLRGLRKLLNTYVENMDTEELYLLPNIWSVGKIRKYLSNYQFEENEYKIVPAAGTVLVQKAEGSLRVINDLNEMVKQNVYNESLDHLLNNSDVSNLFETSIYRSRLNSEQYRALANSYKFSNSVIVGPPGTGKSYTITSIVSDLIANNQSVLVVSKTRQAVEVLRHMLEDDFKLKDYLIHTTGNNYKLSLESKIKKYLSGILARHAHELNEIKLLRLVDKLDRLQDRFEQLIDWELEISDLEFAEELSLWEKVRKFFLDNFYFPGEEVWDKFQEINRLQTQLDNSISTYSRRKIQANIRENSNIYRTDISRFYDALRANSFTEYKNILKKVRHQNILRVFPIWLTNLGDLNSILPLQKDLFDVVIMDEATQCDIATALPAIFRAKRTVIVGDPNQLRHYSFVSQAQQNNLRIKYELPNDALFDYRNRSVLDLFISNIQKQEQVSFLREHFRSTPSLIEFSNQKFYDGLLEVLRSTPKHLNNNQIEVIEIQGSRDQKGVNETEANAVVQKLSNLFQQHKESQFKPSIGVISPFTSQVNFINKLIRDKFDLNTIKSFKLLCGTPYNFQGSEREIVLLSFAVCDNTHASAFNHANKPEVLNVAITRARSYQYVFKSVSDKKLPKSSLLSEYFQFLRSFGHLENEKYDKDLFQEEVAKGIRERGFSGIHFAYPVAGCLLDILVHDEDRLFFIDLIGYPGMFKEAFTLERYQTLARVGIKSIPLHYSFWIKDREEALNRVVEFMR